jgi:hypothetical protein
MRGVFACSSSFSGVVEQQQDCYSASPVNVSKQIWLDSCSSGSVWGNVLRHLSALDQELRGCTEVSGSTTPSIQYREIIKPNHCPREEQQEIRDWCWCCKLVVVPSPESAASADGGVLDVHTVCGDADAGWCWCCKPAPGDCATATGLLLLLSFLPQGFCRRRGDYAGWKAYI